LREVGLYGPDDKTPGCPARRHDAPRRQRSGSEWHLLQTHAQPETELRRELAHEELVSALRHAIRFARTKFAVIELQLA
jgi:hypothetical protein